MEVNNHVRSNVRHLRSKLGWTQQELARHMKLKGFDWTRSIVSNIETINPDTGRPYRPIRLDEGVALAELFETSIEDLVKGRT